MESPSMYVIDFERKATTACHGATNDKKEYQACVSLLIKHSYIFVRDQHIGEPVHQSCLSTSATNCVKNEVVVLCDKRKKKGLCHVIPMGVVPVD